MQVWPANDGGVRSGPWSGGADRWALGLNIYAAIALIAAAIAIVTGFVSRVIVFRHFRDLS
ncbi:MAG: hypothetical protein DLM68_02460 [Hyphomicrobiales bacterium]|nr:MAG: hypothetical protein DLM68_02460 [Hyphomicrobiales bacterium]